MYRQFHHHSHRCEQNLDQEVEGGIQDQMALGPLDKDEG